MLKQYPVSEGAGFSGGHDPDGGFCDYGAFIFTDTAADTASKVDIGQFYNDRFSVRSGNRALVQPDGLG